MFSALDHALMAHALRLAAHGLATTQPNPRVGCVIARGDAIVGEGWHRRAGEPHAEVLALQAAGGAARGSTAYVTLEPCGLHGRTPPCADALVAAGIVRVVVAAPDAAQDGGHALERLRAAGIVVQPGLMSEPARELNRGFHARVERGRPWLRLKLASSLDGRTALASGESKWITGDAARADVQHWRARSSALVTGIGTVLADDPRLTPRSERVSADAVAPLRVVIDSALRTPRGAHVLDRSAPTLVFHGADARADDDRFAGVELVALERSGDGLDLGAVLAELAARGMNEVQVEAGPTLCGAFWSEGLVDELLLYIAPVLLGDDARALLALAPIERMADRVRLRVHEQRTIGSDIRLLLRPERE